VSLQHAAGPPGRGGGEGVRIRDHLANVRTFLAWLRAGLVLLAMGYALAKFQVVESRPSLYIGTLCAAAGWLVIVAAGAGFFRQRRAIESATFTPSTSWNAGLALLSAVAGGAVLFYLLRY
jgi:putative membrane protein